MKNCTKLHFERSYTDDYGVLKTKTIEDFFLGGSLEYDGEDILYRAIENDMQYTYKLTQEDKKLFIDFNKLTNMNGTQYAKILPIYDAQSLKQNLECRCSTIRGELPYDIRQGIPLKVTNEDRRLAILNLINKTPGVQVCSVLREYTIGREYKLDLQIQSNFGEFVMSLS